MVYLEALQVNDDSMARSSSPRKRTARKELREEDSDEEKR